MERKRKRYERRYGDYWREQEEIEKSRSRSRRGGGRSSSRGGGNEFGYDGVEGMRPSYEGVTCSSVPDAPE